ncbi:DUF5719 family protein [Aeromicrobium terrae]|uniref:Secreted protein n=1 Tax=Aeromicrobium terrae TaxID=2498846 RepID=A0A5C8NEQ7_9ACTN|nr:DUF5719 family protein [Aeromicrobium terrae]TXL57335.1 hypothetical protein FHP06_14965 [Aeromicrobium terrae]
MNSMGSRVLRTDRPDLAARLRNLAPPVVGAGLLVLAAVVPAGGDDSRPPVPVTVQESSYACPAGQDITVAAGQVERGTGATAQALPGKTPVTALADAGAWRTTQATGSGVIVRQKGRASGAVGFYAGTASKKHGGGLAVGSCPATFEEGWFLGLGSGAEHESTLVLTNLSESPAVADLTFWGPRGPVDAIDADGIVVDPFTTKRVKLADLAAGEPELAVHVVRRRGSLSVVADDESTAVFKGTEPVSSSLAPSRSQVVPGLPGDADGRTLLLLNPGEQSARVGVRVIGPKSTFTPQGLATVKVGPGRLKAVEVPRSAGSGRIALRLTSDHPVAASVRIAPDTKDRAYAEAVAPLEGTAVVPVELGDDLKAPELVLTAPRRAGSAHLVAYDARMRRLAEHDVTIAAGTTQHVALAKELKAKGIAYVLLTVRGTVLGAATYTDGHRVSSLVLAPAPVTVLGPQVR